MSALSDRLLLFDWDGVYRDQNFYSGRPCRRVPRPAGGVFGYCGPEAEAALRREFSAGPLPPVRFLGSGDYHYLSALLAACVRGGFELLLFDHHSDMRRPAFGPLLSCGSWARWALGRLPALRGVVLAGASERDLSGLPADKPVRCLPEPGPAELERALSGSRLPLCVSVDKDVFGRGAALTDWDQGHLEPDVFAALFCAAARMRPLLSLDVCGEFPPQAGNPGQALRAARFNNRMNARLLRLWDARNKPA